MIGIYGLDTGSRPAVGQVDFLLQKIWLVMDCYHTSKIKPADNHWLLCCERTLLWWPERNLTTGLRSAATMHMGTREEPDRGSDVGIWRHHRPVNSSNLSGILDLGTAGSKRLWCKVRPRSSFFQMQNGTQTRLLKGVRSSLILWLACWTFHRSCASSDCDEDASNKVGMCHCSCFPSPPFVLRRTMFSLHFLKSQ